MGKRSVSNEIPFGPGHLEPDRQQDGRDTDEHTHHPEHGPFATAENRLLFPKSHG